MVDGTPLRRSRLVPRSLLALAALLVPAEVALGSSRIDAESHSTSTDQTVRFERPVRARRVPQLVLDWPWPSDLAEVSAGLLPRIVLCEVYALRGKTQVKGVWAHLEVRLYNHDRMVLAREATRRTGKTGQIFLQLDFAPNELHRVTHAQGIASFQGTKRLDRITFSCQGRSSTSRFFPTPRLVTTTPERTEVRRSHSRGSSYLILGRAAAADDFPILSNSWSWPLAFMPDRPRFLPLNLNCYLIVVRKGENVRGVRIRYRARLERDDELLFERKGRARSGRDDIFISIPLGAAGIDSSDLVSVEFDSRGSRKFSFMRFDCYARVSGL